MQINKVSKIVLSIISGIAMAGCASMLDERRESISDTLAQAQANLAPHAIDQNNRQYPQVKNLAQAYIPTVNTKFQKTKFNPVLQTPIFLNMQFNDINEAVSWLSTRTGLLYDVQVSDVNVQTSKVITYEGRLSGLLDIIATSFGLTWEDEDNVILFYDTVTKSFLIKTLPGNATTNTSVTTSSSSGGAAGSSSISSAGTQSAVYNSSLETWNGIEAAINTMLSEQGKISTSPALGMLTVTDIPPVVANIERFVKQINEHIIKQVAISVRVLSVRLSNSDNYGIQWDAVWAAMSNNAGNITFKSALAAESTSNQLTATLFSTDNGGRGDWAGSNAIVSALSKQGDVSTVTSATSITLNNQPVPIQVGKQIAYLASSSTTSSGDATDTSGDTTQLTPGTLNTGFNLQIHPSIQDDGLILLQFGLSISSLDKLETVSAGNSSIQTPEVSSQNFMQRVAMTSGETLLLTGFEQVNDEAKSQGIGSADAVWAGGALTGSSTRDVLVILLRPILI